MGRIDRIDVEQYVKSLMARTNKFGTWVISKSKMESSVVPDNISVMTSKSINMPHPLVKYMAMYSRLRHTQELVKVMESEIEEQN